MTEKVLHILSHPITNLLIGLCFIGSAVYEIVSEVPEEIGQSVTGAHYAMLLLGALVVVRSLGEISEALTDTSLKWKQSDAPLFHRTAGKLLAWMNQPVVVVITAVCLLLGGGADAWEYFDTADVKGVTTAAMVILIGLSMLSFLLLGGIEAADKLKEENIQVSSLFPAQFHSVTVMLSIALIVFGISVAEEMVQVVEFFEFTAHRSAALWSGIEILKNIMRSISLAKESITERSQG